MPIFSKFPQLGNQVPQRSSSTSRLFWQKVTQLQGWQVLGEIPNIPHAVLIAAPHTTNMDGILGIQLALALGLDVSIMFKEELYRAPLRGLWDWGNAIPVNRASATGLVEQMCEIFKQRDKFWLAIAPEGTRKSATTWKRGFYHIAVAAQVPIVMVGFDYAKKAVIFLGLFEPTGDFDADLPKILAFYKGLTAGNPDNLSLPLRD